MAKSNLNNLFCSVAGASVTLIIFPTPAIAQETGNFSSLVSTFEQKCLMSGTNHADRIAALESDPNWKSNISLTIPVPKLEISRAIDRNYSFQRPSNIREWSGSVDNHAATFLLASFEGKVRYQNICALILEGPEQAMPFSDQLETAFKRFGIKGKSVDLVHYFEFAGKVGGEKHPVRGEIFTRSFAGTAKKTTHIYVAY